MNNNYGQNNYYGVYQQPTGYSYPQNQNLNPVVLTQLLTKEEEMELQKNPQHFHTKLSREEYLRSICTHKANNTFALEALPNGKHRCKICGAEFTLIPTDTAIEDIEAMCATFNDLFQSIKTYYPSPSKDIKDFYLMNGFIDKIPYLWQVAAKLFNEITRNQNVLQQNNDNVGFAALANIFGAGSPMTGMFPGAGAYYQPGQMYNNYGAQPYYGQGNPMGTPTAPYSNQMPPAAAVQQPNAGMYYGNPPQPQAPMGVNNGTAFNNNPGYQPQYQAPVPQVSGAQPSSMNPIGYVEPQPQQDFTNNQTTVNQQVSVPVPGPSLSATAQGTAPLPEAPKNPNVKETKTNKKF